MSGGSTLYDGIAARLEKEIDNLAPTVGMVNVLAPKDRYFSVWKGGSTLSSLASFESSWITKDEFNECGVEIVHRKCM